MKLKVEENLTSYEFQEVLKLYIKNVDIDEKDIPRELKKYFK